MEKASLEHMIKYLTEPYYPEKVRIEDFKAIFATINTALSNEKFRLAQQQANNNKYSLTKRSKAKETDDKAKSTYSTSKQCGNSSNKNTSTARSTFQLEADANNQITIRRIEGKKPIETSTAQRKKNMLDQLISERNNNCKTGPSEYTLKPKVKAKQFTEVPISSAINRYQYQYTT